MSTTTSPPAPGWFNRIGGRLLARQPVAQAAAAPAALKQTGEERRCPTLSILAGALRTPHGASADELAAALAANKVDADLDRELLDEDSFPVMSARCDQAGDEAVREEIADWLVAEEGVPLTLQLAPVLPDDWQEEQRQAASMWCRQVLAQSGWPAARIGPVEPAAPAMLIARLAQETENKAATILLAFARTSARRRSTAGLPTARCSPPSTRAAAFPAKERPACCWPPGRTAPALRASAWKSTPAIPHPPASNACRRSA